MSEDKLMFQACCHTGHREFVSNRDEINQARERIVNDIMSDTDRHCYVCNHRENHGLRTTRRAANNIISDNAAYGDSHLLEIQIDTTCNAACIMCGPQYSSLWRHQNNDDYADIDVTDYYNQLYSLTDFDKLQMIRFLGGEPMLGNHNVNLIKKVVDPSQVTLNYTTNGSIFPDDDLRSLWSQFKAVKLIVSIDGVGEKFEYVRWPLKWQKIERNFQLLLEDPTIELQINYTINPLNAWYADEIVTWLDKQPNGSRCHIAWHPCNHGPLHLENCPESLRDHVKSKLGEDHDVNCIMDNTQSVNPKSIVNYLSDLDIKRKTDWRKTFSDVQHHFK